MKVPEVELRRLERWGRTSRRWNLAAAFVIIVGGALSIGSGSEVPLYVALGLTGVWVVTAVVITAVLFRRSTAEIDKYYGALGRGEDPDA